MPARTQSPDPLYIKLLEVGNSKLSEILNGKRPPDVRFLKAAHTKLGIDAAFLLNHA